MAHWVDANIAVEKRVQDNWTTTRVHFWSSGIQFVPGQEEARKGYIAILVEEFTGDQVSLGDPPQLYRYQGQITIQIFTPERAGSKIANGYADTLDSLFRRAVFSQGGSGTITCRTPQKTNIGVRDNWYQVNLRIPYQRDKLH